MKINPPSPAELTGASASTAAKAGTGTPAGRSGDALPVSAAPPPTAPAATAVTVSSLARSLEPKAAGAAAGVSASQPDFNAQKVAEVRAAIAQGTYKVDAGAIADKLLSNAQQLLRRSSDA